MVQFGTSGVRGRVVDLTDPLCADYAEAFLRGAAHGGQVLIGQDLRESSARIAGAVAAGARRCGVEPVDCGVLPTPALALAAGTRGVAAVMVTGSHIPADRNGMKFYVGAAEITKADEARIKAAVSALPRADVTPLPFPADPTAGPDFTDRIVSFIGAGALQGMRIGVWQHSSAARDMMVGIITALGGDAIALGRSEGFVPVDTEAVDTTTRAQLARWAETGLDAIISTDGDADRPLLTDAMGTVIPGDVIGPLVASAIGAEAVVTPVSSNTNVERMQVFASVRRCRIGSPYVIEGMAQARAEGAQRVVGYEANGGFLLGFAPTPRMLPLETRDFALPLFVMLARARAHPGGLAALVADLPARVTAANRLQDIDRAGSDRIIESLRAGNGPEGLPPIAARDETDGLRLTLEGGPIVHLRPSGNAPELRCYVETDDRETADRMLAFMLEWAAAQRESR